MVYFAYSKAKEFVHSLGLNTRLEWRIDIAKAGQSHKTFHLLQAECIEMSGKDG